MQLFVTGFGPFGPFKVNPSEEVARHFSPDFEVLDVSYAAVDAWVAEADLAKFDHVLLTGVATDRPVFSFELFARNYKGKAKDNAGLAPLEPIRPEGPLILEGTLWDADWLAETLDASSKMSLNAGPFLCNYIYYRALEKWPDKRIGFLHLPDLKFVAIEAQIEKARAITDRLSQRLPLR